MTKTFATNTQVLSYIICVMLFFFGYSSTTSLSAAPAHAPIMPKKQQKAQTTTERKTILSLFTQKKTSSKTTVKHKADANPEIWSRLRSRLSLLASPPQKTLYQRHLKSLATHQDYINKVVRNASPYLFYILEEVEKRDMPNEIALLPIIESDFNPQTTSPRGAAGLWQLMPSLGRSHGLKQNASFDGRRDVYESTQVALDHLQYLHRKFNHNWLLALAAYNCGEVKLHNAIKQNRLAHKSTELSALNLPKETHNFVPKLLALATIINTPSEFGVVLPAIKNEPAIARVQAPQKMTIAQAAKLAAISETQLLRLNAGLKKAATPQLPSQLVVPYQQAAFFSPTTAKQQTKQQTVIAAAPKAKPAEIKPTNSNGLIHVVKKGESIPIICKKYQLKVKEVVVLNQFKNEDTIIFPGQKIKLS